jgi:tetratricopeptide (TPR) repeat protein
MSHLCKRKNLFYPAAFLIMFFCGCGGDDPVADSGELNISQVLKAGWRQFSIQDTESSIRNFTHVLNEEDVPADKKIQALYGLGLSYKFAAPKPDLEMSRKHFNSILQEYPDDNSVPWVMLELGNIAAKTGERSKARSLYERVLSEKENTAAADEAVLRLAQLYFTDYDSDEDYKGVDILKRYLEEKPDNPLARVMLFRVVYRLGETNQKYMESLPYAERLGEMKMFDPFRWGQQFWYLGQVYRLIAGNEERAAYWYQKILDECEFDQRRYSSRQMLEKIREDSE